MRDPAELRRRAGTRGDPDRDQYFLDDDRVLARIISYASEIEMALDPVLEIGPGTGALTAHLLETADRVVAIERDRELVGFLREEFREAIDDGRLALVAGDATADALPDYASCISNLPYGAASEILFRLLPRRRPVLVMVQREFAERMAADPGTSEYGRLSVTAQHYGTVRIHEIVPPAAFVPEPPVESALVSVSPAQPSYELTSDDRFFDVVRALFTQRRKTVRNAIRNTTHISEIDDAAGLIDQLPDALLGKRPDAVTPAEYALIANEAEGV